MDRTPHLWVSQPAFWQSAVWNSIPHLLLYRWIDPSAVCKCSKSDGRCKKAFLDNRPGRAASVCCCKHVCLVTLFVVPDQCKRLSAKTGSKDGGTDRRQIRH